MALLSASSLNSRFVQLLAAAIFLIGILWFLVPDLDIRERIHVPYRTASHDHHTSNPESDLPSRPRPDHPIDHLVREADAELKNLLAKETTTLHDAAAAYRARRGRQPPPGFDVWFAFAQNHTALIIEDFFDQIYDDLNPFWGVPAQQMREQAAAHKFLVQVRDGNATKRTDHQRPWMDLWHNLTSTIAEVVPDVDIPINEMDESRMVVEWEEIQGYMAQERQGRRIVDERDLKTTFQKLPDVNATAEEEVDLGFQTEGPYWEKAVIGCPPDSEARKAVTETDFSTPPPLSEGFPPGSYKGYVRNWTLACSPCDNAHLQGLHGTFVEPISISNTRKFFPLFGGSKLPMNNEILLPPAMYWTDDPFYSGGEKHGSKWAKKKDKLVWRGAASGGRNREENWTRFQRHRFVSMVNATSVHYAETGQKEMTPNFVLPANGTYDLVSRTTTGGLSAWIKTWSNAAVVHLLCFGYEGFGKFCPYTNPYYSVEKVIPMAEQYSYKYLPDIDGNSFSGRYRGFLGSTSLPMKATIYKEWHDSRLVPWKHFVPMDNTFADIYGLMEYFLGNDEAELEGHDDVAEAIAMDGKAWAERVLRREDMMVYVLRLLLEYARLCDDDRERMGWREVREGEIGDGGVT